VPADAPGATTRARKKARHESLSKSKEIAEIELDSEEASVTGKGKQKQRLTSGIRQFEVGQASGFGVGRSNTTVADVIDAARYWTTKENTSAGIIGTLYKPEIEMMRKHLAKVTNCLAEIARVAKLCGIKLE